ncbi:sulfur carrier protein ThiS [Heliorestis acidaminivorans]|uniref:Sulfur carrier protein ThiS n=1 Tax=Heliorestis acidaminivorans TaxID=553427 RepID=A0A6I0F4W1_9FIRM|nr:sulfur carrier protein ThiS [Heliorestis acidaminivorans]KAB2954553.1 sulfur carrier protein ThiS [Heliorestis acidaminivorans]
MTVTINGEQVEVATGTTLISYLKEKELPMEGLIIEYNGTIIYQDDWEKIEFIEGDKIEILTFVGGG